MPRAVPLRQDISADELRRCAKHETDGRAARPMLALAAVLDGASRADAARLAGMNRQSLRDWAHRFNAAGIEGLHDRPHTGRPSRLSDGQQAAFKALVLRGPDIERDGVSSWTAKDLCRIVEERYQVSYSENGMLKLLHSLDLSWQKTRPVHPKADRKAQAEFKKTSWPDRGGQSGASRGRADRGLAAGRDADRPDRAQLQTLVSARHPADRCEGPAAYRGLSLRRRLPRT